ncbi:hypothetical protein D0T50_07475 [Bacteroides sp. 214]|nr:hypothetical protein [Bacteroides sp. 214]
MKLLISIVSNCHQNRVRVRTQRYNNFHNYKNCHIFVQEKTVIIVHQRNNIYFYEVKCREETLCSNASVQKRDE